MTLTEQLTADLAENPSLAAFLCDDMHGVECDDPDERRKWCVGVSAKMLAPQLVKWFAAHEAAG